MLNLIVLSSSVLLAQAAPTAVAFVPINGNPTTLSPNVFIGNLDAGDLVAGNTRWDHNNDGLFFAETYVGHVWTPTSGISPFAVSSREYETPQRHFPAEIALNGHVVGSVNYLSTFETKPFLWNGSFALMPLPSRNWTGSASAIASSGVAAVGEVRNGIGPNSPTSAAHWRISGRGRAQLGVLETTEAWSTAHDVSGDGSVVVGDAGAGNSSYQATRWVGGQQQALSPVGSLSTALFTSEDGSLAIGMATLGGQGVLVRWNADGAAEIYAPSVGSSVSRITAISPSGSAVVGSLLVNGNAAPFVWTAADGFVVLPEFGRELDYDASVARDVSDDGNVVVGAVQASVVSNGDPPYAPFVWTRSAGMSNLNDLASAGGLGSLGIYDAYSVSGDGTRILVGSAHPRSLFDADAGILHILP
jgi:uncharacterized membrane protein